jgi:hypothetical protein
MSHTHTDYAARKHPEFVVLDIGEDTGALIIQTDSAMHGVEIEISRSGHLRDGAHKQVLERTIAGEPAYTAVFDNLGAGSYTLWTGDRAAMRDVEIEGGSIAQLDWRQR